MGAEKFVTLTSLQAAAAHIAMAQGALGAAHLRYQLTMIELLSPGQIASDSQLARYA